MNDQITDVLNEFLKPFNEFYVRLKIDDEGFISTPIRRIETRFSLTELGNIQKQVKINGLDCSIIPVPVRLVGSFTRYAFKVEPI